MTPGSKKKIKNRNFSRCKTKNRNNFSGYKQKAEVFVPDIKPKIEIFLPDRKPKTEALLPDIKPKTEIILPEIKLSIKPFPIHQHKLALDDNLDNTDGQTESIEDNLGLKTTTPIQKA